MLNARWNPSCIVRACESRVVRLVMHILKRVKRAASSMGLNRNVERGDFGAVASKSWWGDMMVEGRRDKRDKRPFKR